MKENKGYIYILTNPSFPDYVKIGYADDVEKRLNELNRSECTPFAFRVYATYAVNVRLSDIKIHNVIDKLNPNLRSIDNINGKKRVREFYAMSPKDAYSILEAIAEINGLESNLVKWKKTEEESEEEELANEIKIERLSNFKFSKCNIKIGEEIVSLEKPEIRCVVIDDNHVEYNGEKYSLSALAKEVLDKNYSFAGPRHFTYKGEILSELRNRIEGNE